MPPNHTSADGCPFSSSIFAATSPVDRRCACTSMPYNFLKLLHTAFKYSSSQEPYTTSLPSSFAAFTSSSEAPTVSTELVSAASFLPSLSESAFFSELLQAVRPNPATTVLTPRKPRRVRFIIKTLFSFCGYPQLQ